MHGAAQKVPEVAVQNADRKSSLGRVEECHSGECHTATDEKYRSRDRIQRDEPAHPKATEVPTSHPKAGEWLDECSTRSDAGEWLDECSTRFDGCFDDCLPAPGCCLQVVGCCRPALGGCECCPRSDAGEWLDVCSTRSDAGECFDECSLDECFDECSLPAHGAPGGTHVGPKATVHADADEDASSLAGHHCGSTEATVDADVSSFVPTEATVQQCRC